MDREKKNQLDHKHAYKQALPFFVVKIFPKNSFRMYNNCEQVLSSFLKRDDEQSFHISKKIRNKALNREKLFQSINDSEDLIELINRSIEEKECILTRLRYKALDLLLSETKRREEELLTLKKMLHRSKNLAQEKSVLRKINVRQQQLGQSDDTSLTSCLTEELIGEFKQIIHWMTPRSDCDYSSTLNPYEHNYRRLLQELRNLKKETICDLRECLEKIKFIRDEFVEMNKEKGELETKIRIAKNQIKRINEQIWSSQTHLKHKHCRTEASFFIVTERKSKYGSELYSKCFYWKVGCGNLEYDSLDSFAALL